MENINGDHVSSEPGPAATMVGNIVMGTRIGGAAGREIADIEEDSDMARKVTQFQYPYLPHRSYFVLITLPPPLSQAPPHLAKNSNLALSFSLLCFLLLRTSRSFR